MKVYKKYLIVWLLITAVSSYGTITNPKSNIASTAKEQTIISKARSNAFRVVKAVARGTYTVGRAGYFVFGAVNAADFVGCALMESGVSFSERCCLTAMSFCYGSAVLAMYRSLRNGDNEVLDGLQKTGRAASLQGVKKYLLSLDKKGFAQLIYAVGRGIAILELFGYMTLLAKDGIAGRIIDKKDSEFDSVMQIIFDDGMTAQDKAWIFSVVTSLCILLTFPAIIALCRSLKNGDKGFEGTAISELLARVYKKTEPQATADKQEKKMI